MSLSGGFFRPGGFEGCREDEKQSPRLMWVSGGTAGRTVRQRWQRGQGSQARLSYRPRRSRRPAPNCNQTRRTLNAQVSAGSPPPLCKLEGHSGSLRTHVPLSYVPEIMLKLCSGAKAPTVDNLSASITRARVLLLPGMAADVPPSFTQQTRSPI